MTEFTALFKKKDETKGTWRYAEVEPDKTKRPAIGSMYLTKDRLKELDWPQELEVTVKVKS